MPTNNFKLFDENKANMMTDEEYAINQQRLNGVQSGVASSQLQNKTLYQTALMCYALAQLMAANGYDANDANAVSTFVNNLSSSVLQKVADKASVDDVERKVAGKWVDAKQLGEFETDVADNYLPLLGGTMLGDLFLNRNPVSSLQAATKQYVDGFCKIKTGSYVGTGTYGQSNPTVINCGFKPKMLFIYLLNPTYSTAVLGSSYIGVNFVGWAEGITTLKSASYPPTDLIHFTQLDDGLSFYGVDSSYNNDAGVSYYYVVLG